MNAQTNPEIDVKDIEHYVLCAMCMTINSVTLNIILMSSNYNCIQQLKKSSFVGMYAPIIVF